MPDVFKTTLKDIDDFLKLYPEYKNQILVETRFGYKEIEESGITEKNSKVLLIELQNGLKIGCSPKHLLYKQNKWKKAKTLKIKDKLLTKFGESEIKSIYYQDYTEDLYDLQVKDVKEYYANNIVSHNSTLLDAITFALYGRAYRKCNKPTLVNSINEKDCVVELLFATNGKNYKIIRGLKPAIFEIYCDGILIDQDKSVDYQDYLELNILKMNFKSFSQVVILGSATFTPFMQLTAAGRREIVESLLDIQIFSDMNVVTKDLILTNKQNYDDLKYKLQLEIDKKIFLEKHIKNDSIKNNNLDVVSIQNEIDQNLIDINEYTLDIEKIEKSLILKDKFKTLSDTLFKSYTKTESKIEELEEKINVLENNRICPTCEQDIDPEFSKSHVKHIETLVSDNIQKLEDIKDKSKKTSQQILKFEKSIKEIQNLDKQRSILEETNKTYQKQLEQFANNKSVLFDVDNSKEKDLEVVNSAIDALNIEKNKLVEEKRYLDYALSLFRDGGIKTKIVKQYLPIINATANKYLSILNQNSNIVFTLNESFEEEIKSRGRDLFSYYNFSEGEKLRVDLALLLTWRLVAKNKNSVNTNLLIMDEILDRSLDIDGIEGFMKILLELETDGINTFIISHKDGMIDRFKNILRFEKVNNFSELKKA